MTHSIGRRVRRTVLLAIVMTLFVTVTSVFVANENLERSVLEIDIQAERDFILEHTDLDTPLSWDTASLKAFYQPPDSGSQNQLPEIFRGLPFPFSGEIEINGSTFLMTLGEAKGGRLYIAKDISIFEHRETLFQTFLLVLGGVVLVLGALLAHLTTQRLVTPLRQLTDHIRVTQPAPKMPRIAREFKDRELREIADTFNLFLDEIEAYVKREQSLLSLASHELRTPIAVIMGALEVIDQRGTLSPEDYRTVQRIARASAEMSANIDTILKLTRRRPTADERDHAHLPDILRDVIEDLDRSTGGKSRIRVKAHNPPPLLSDPLLIKMLLRNLLQNALQHTHDTVDVIVDNGVMEIADRGHGLPESQKRLLRDELGDASALLALSGLGLFIVTLVCDRLGWRLEVVQSSTDGTTLRLHYPKQTNVLEKM